MKQPLSPQPMALRSLTRDEVRDVERRAIEDLGVPGIVLMENAGHGVAELLIGLGIGGRVVIVAGKGNNGGDGFVIARHLEIRGFDVRVLLLADPQTLTGDAASNFRVLRASGTPIRVVLDLAGADLAAFEEELLAGAWIVDALLGTGTRGQLREPFFTAIDRINSAGVPVLAVDLPSGLDCDTGQPLGTCVRATHTATFVAPKCGFEAPGAAAYTGKVQVIDIGVPRTLLQRFVLSAG